MRSFLASAAAGVALITAFPALAELEAFGPQNQFGFPQFYMDKNGLALAQCIDPADPACLLLPLPNPGSPPNVANGNFFGESFYSLSDVTFTTPYGTALLVLRVQALFGNAAGAVVDGDQVVFSRVRFRIDGPAGTYKVTYPYGAMTFTNTPGGRRTVNFTSDCIGNLTCAPGVNAFTTPLDPAQSPIGPFLQWDPVESAPPAGHIGDGVTPHTVIGSPTGFNKFRIEFPTGEVFESDRFLVVGRIDPNAHICGNGRVEITEQCDDGNLVNGDGCSNQCQIEGAPAGTTSFLPVADAKVRVGSATNFGTATDLRVRSAGPAWNSYLKFNLSGLGGAVASAKLRLFNTDASGDGGSVFTTASTWTETGINSGTAPAIGGTPVASAGPVSAGSWVELDVTPAVTGNGVVSFGLRSGSTNSAFYSSREGANPPQLLITTQGAPSVCGNGVLEPGEQCDDGNTVAGDGCSAVCQLEVAPPSTLSFTPQDDAKVSAEQPTSNFGAISDLRVRSPLRDWNSFLQFVVAGISKPVVSAKLRLFCTDESPNGGTLFQTPTGWAEETVTWNTKPTLGAVVAQTGVVTAGAWVEVDVTSLVTGNGTYSFGLSSNSSNSAFYSSKEGANAPQLVIQTAP